MPVTSSDKEASTMNRRFFVFSCLTLMVTPSLAAVALANKKFVFKVKTKSGGIVGNILIEAKDVFAAISKLKKRYPGCTVLEAREK